MRVLIELNIKNVYLTFLSNLPRFSKKNLDLIQRNLVEKSVARKNDLYNVMHI